MPEVRIVTTGELDAAECQAVRALLDAAFDGDFTDDDWAHALGGWHVLVTAGLEPLAHGSVVPRRLQAGPRTFRAGYVEAVGVRPGHQRTGLGTAVMRALTEVTRQRFELGALSTSEWGFYARLGWERWRGATWVRTGDGRRVRTADDDEGIMVLRCDASHDLDLGLELTCDERRGDHW